MRSYFETAGFLHVKAVFRRAEVEQLRRRGRACSCEDHTRRPVLVVVGKRLGSRGGDAHQLPSGAIRPVLQALATTRACFASPELAGTGRAGVRRPARRADGVHQERERRQGQRRPQLARRRRSGRSSRDVSAHPGRDPAGLTPTRRTASCSCSPARIATRSTGSRGAKRRPPVGGARDRDPVTSHSTTATRCTRRPRPLRPTPAAARSTTSSPSRRPSRGARRTATIQRCDCSSRRLGGAKRRAALPGAAAWPKRARSGL